MVEILHHLKGPKLWELWYIPDDNLNLNQKRKPRTLKSQCRAYLDAVERVLVTDHLPINSELSRHWVRGFRV